MELQQSLQGENVLQFGKPRKLIQLTVNKQSLENEKKKFLNLMVNFIDSIDFEERQKEGRGRPNADLTQILKCCLVMTYNGMSYRRSETDFNELYERGMIKYIPKRSTLNKYMNLGRIRRVIENLIQVSASFFIEHEDIAILDSTWLAYRMYTGGYRKVHDKKSTSLAKCRKLHICCLKNSKVIACAKITQGTSNDSPHLKDMIMKVVRSGFAISNLLADAGYSSKSNYSFCRSLNIFNVFIDFASNVKLKPKGRTPWATQLKLMKDSPEVWHERYRYRVLVESVFSSMKRKQTNWIRSQKEIARDNELLLKALVYNLCVVGRYF